MIAQILSARVSSLNIIEKYISPQIKVQNVLLTLSLGGCLSQLIMNVLTFDDTQCFSLLPTEVSVLLRSSDCSIHTVYTIHIYNIDNTNMNKPFSRKCQKRVHPHSGYHHCRHLDLCSTFPLIADCAIHTLRSLNATNYYQSVHHFKHVQFERKSFSSRESCC